MSVSQPYPQTYPPQGTPAPAPGYAPQPGFPPLGQMPGQGPGQMPGGQMPGGQMPGGQMPGQFPGQPPVRPGLTAAMAGAAERPNLLHALVSESTKLWTTRSTLWLLICATLSMPLVDFAISSHYAGLEQVLRSQFTTDSSIAALVALLLYVPLGVMVITTEYSSGMIRNIFTACPRRGRVLTAKTLMLLVGTLVTATLLSLVSLYVAHAMLPGNFGEPVASGDLLTTALRSGVYLTLATMFSYGLGAILKRSAPAILIMMAVIFVPFVVAVIAGGQQGSLGEKLMNYSLISGLLSQFNPQDAPWDGPSATAILVYLGIAAVVALAGSYALVLTRDT